MSTPSEEPNTPTVPEAESPLEDQLDDLVDAAEQFKEAILQLKSLDKESRTMVERFICENRSIFEGFSHSLEAEDQSAEN